MSKNDGFTLIELVTLIVIMGILAFVLVAKFPFETSSLVAARIKLMSDIRYAQSLAASRGKIYGIEFFPASETYDLYENTPATKIKDPVTPDADFIVNYTTAREFHGVNMVSASFGGGTRLEFDWRGVPLDSAHLPLSADGTIVLQTAAGTTTVVVTQQTGRATYQ